MPISVCTSARLTTGSRSIWLLPIRSSASPALIGVDVGKNRFPLQIVEYLAGVLIRFNLHLRLSDDAITPRWSVTRAVCNRLARIRPSASRTVIADSSRRTGSFTISATVC